MRHVRDEEGREHVELSAKEARQGGRGRVLLYILIGVLAGLAMGAAFIAAGF